VKELTWKEREREISKKEVKSELDHFEISVILRNYLISEIEFTTYLLILNTSSGYIIVRKIIST
jgi:hypothetical protein